MLFATLLSFSGSEKPIHTFVSNYTNLVKPPLWITFDPGRSLRGLFQDSSAPLRLRLNPFGAFASASPREKGAPAADTPMPIRPLPPPSHRRRFPTRALPYAIRMAKQLVPVIRPRRVVRRPSCQESPLLIPHAVPGLLILRLRAVLP